MYCICCQGSHICIVLRSEKILCQFIKRNATSVVYRLSDFSSVHNVCLPGWFGLRREFCPWLLGVCPVLQEYGNISYKIQGDDAASTEQQEPPEQNMSSKRKAVPTHTKKGLPPEEPLRTAVPILSIEVPD